MDMEDVLATLFEVVTQEDLTRKNIYSRAVQAGRPHYARLQGAVGDEAAEQIWAAALEIGSAGEDAIFRSGLCLGMRLMALCL